MDIDMRYMQRCLDLAAQATGRVSPNPLVGCVIVHEDRIIGEGYHMSFGGSHAEVNAIMAVREKELLSAATLYVNLEPCSHYGKTPPCADLILSHGIPKVVIGTPDPFPLVAGAGINRLREGGTEVHTGLLAKSCRYLNRRFFTYHEKQRPYIILKWAQSADGFLAPLKHHPIDREAYWITGKSSVRLVHKWRTEEDAILVGCNTIVADDPKLTAREWPGKNPLRIILDPNDTLPENYSIYSDEARTFIYNAKRSQTNSQISNIKVESKNFLAGVLQDVMKHGILSILVEGGAYTLNHLIDEGLWDEARVFTGQRFFHQGIIAPLIQVPYAEYHQIGLDRLEIFYNKD